MCLFKITNDICKYLKNKLTYQQKTVHFENKKITLAAMKKQHFICSLVTELTPTIG